VRGHHRDREQVAKRVTAVAVALVVAAVVVAGLPSTRPWTLPTTPTADRASWVMPLDQYVGVGAIASGYAQELMIEKCRTAEGGDGSSVPWRDVAAATTGSERQPVRAFDLADARDRGYHVPPTADAGEAAWRAFVLRPVSAAESVARDRCLDRLYSEHPELLSGDLGTGTGTLSDIAIRLSDAAFRDARDGLHAGDPRRRACRPTRWSARSRRPTPRPRSPTPNARSPRPTPPAASRPGTSPRSTTPSGSTS
jgi:hypothetical protein